MAFPTMVYWWLHVLTTHGGNKQHRLNTVVRENMWTILKSKYNVFDFQRTVYY